MLRFHDSDGRIKRYVGAEIECYNITNKEKVKTVLKKWKADYGMDGSIDFDASDDADPAFIDRGYVNGVWTEGTPLLSAEIRTAPARGQKFIDQISEITEVLKSVGAKVNTTCGLHVHIDARDFEVEDIVKTAYVWSKVEDFFLKQVPAHRQGNGFSEPWDTELLEALREVKKRKAKKKESYKTLLSRLGNSDHNMYDAALAQGYEDLQGVIEDGDKYKALNFMPLTAYGTLENRLLEGTLDAKRIIHWATMNSDMVDFIKTTPLNVIKKARFKTARAFAINIKKGPNDTKI
jgi:hypothetical protein